MGILQKVGLALSPRARLLQHLRELTGQAKGLVERLRLHAQICIYPHIAISLGKVADSVAAQAKLMEEVLTAHRLWAAMPPAPHRHGANNWERVSGDLEALMQLSLELSRLALRLEAIDSAVSDKLRTITRDNVALIDDLREASAKLDPQAAD